MTRVEVTDQERADRIRELTEQRDLLDGLNCYASYDDIPEEILAAYDRIGTELRAIVEGAFSEEELREPAMNHFRKYHCTPRPAARHDHSRRAPQARRAIPQSIRRLPRNRSHRSVATRTTATSTSPPGSSDDDPAPALGWHHVEQKFNCPVGPGEAA